MSTTGISISIREILENLSYIENKMPYKEYSLYKRSAAPSCPITEEAIKQEAQRMLEFVGLGYYTVEVKYVKLEEAGGNILIGNPLEKVFKINISDKFRNNWAASVAVLAHEICHKLLVKYNIVFQEEITNEIHVDLATIYVGFGEVVINGYSTGEYKLGYLESEIYNIAYMFVSMICGNKKKNEICKVETSELIDKTLTLWEKEPDKSKLLKGYIVKKEEDYAEILRNIHLIEQILEHCKKHIVDYFDRYDDKYFRATELVGGECKKPIKAFVNIYEYLMFEDVILDENIKLKKVINETLYNIFTTYQEIGRVELSYETKCPFCGTVFTDDKLKDKKSLIRCPSCQRYYLHNGKTWTPAQYQREIHNKKKQKEEEENRMLEKRRDELEKDAKKKIIEAMAYAQREITDIKENEQERCKEAIRKSIPPIIRWIFNKYINKQGRR